MLITNLLWAQWSIPNTQRDALISIYNTTNGSQWNRPWDLQKDPRNWFGITIKNGDVTEIALNNNALQGVFPNSLSIFTKLSKLDLGNNDLSGEVSTSISTLGALQTLDISNNHLTGDPSQKIASLTKLTTLLIGGNRFEIVNVNALLSNSHQIITLGLSGLQLAEIPQKIASCYNLTDLDLSNNLIVSGFDNLSGLTNLERLNLSNNALITMPNAIKSLKKLIQLNLQGNQITNFDFFTSIQQLEDLNIAENNLTEIPNTISALKNLNHINLNHNKINSGFTKLTVLKKLQQVFLNSNEIYGSFPSELLGIPSLMMLSIRDNHLQGDLPNNLPPICDISNNRFLKHTIENFFTNNIHNNDSFFYSPQRYDEPTEVKGVLGETVALHQNISGTDYHFSWYKNLDENMNISTENLFFNEIKLENYAIYTAEAYTYKMIGEQLMQISFFREPIVLTDKLGINEPTAMLQIFPNPTTDFINIISTHHNIEKSTIYDLSGKQVLTTTATKINVSVLPSGVYMLNIKLKEGIKNFKFVKQ